MIGDRAAPRRDVALRHLSVTRTSVGLVVRAAVEVWRSDPAGSVTAASLQVIGAGSALGLVWAGKLAFDAVLDPIGKGTGLVMALLLLAILTAINGSVGVVAGQQQRLLGERVAQRVWNRILDAASRVDMVTYESPGFSTRLERVQQNAVLRPSAVATAILGLTGGGLSVLAMCGALIGIEPLLVPLLLVAGLPAVLLSQKVARLEFAFVSGVTPLVRRRFYLRQLLGQRQYATELRAFGTAMELRSRHDVINKDFVARLGVHVRRRQVIALLVTLGTGVALGLALLAVVALVRDGRITLAEAGASALALRLLSGQLSSVFTAVGSLLESAPFLADLDDFMASVPPPGPVGQERGLDHEISLRDVWFRYPEGSRDALAGVDLDIGAGQVIALVGENGSGKTTLAKIVAGIYEPDRGEVRWDGNAVSTPDVRASVSVIFQDFVRYQMSVRDNIALTGSADPTAEAGILEAAARAGFGPAIHDLPDGLDSMLGRDLDEGTDLSGGQWQRLALARALHRDRSLIVLDEPTAALDPRAESELFSDVRAILDGRAALLVTHRFSSVRLADRIYVLDGGRVVETGSHEELVASAGLYAELYALQSAAYR